jgi:DNA-binding transcriptional ArsR family regulator
MKNIGMAIAVGLLAFAGAALADSAVISAQLHTPAGDSEPVEVSPTGLPAGAGSVSFGEHMDGANQAFDENGVPFEMQRQSDGLRPNVRCNADLPPEACVTDEPSLAYPSDCIDGALTCPGDYLALTQDSAGLRQWVSVDSKEATQQAFTYAPEGAIDPETRAQIEDANDQLNGAIDVAFIGNNEPGGFHGRGPKGLKGDASGSLTDLNIQAGGGLGPLGDGHDAGWLPEGFDEVFEGAPIDLQPTSADDGAGVDAQGDGQQGSGSADIGAMALGAALIGGAILGPMALYHRIRSNHTLNNKTRQMVYDAVVKGPGIGVNDAAKAADCSYSTAAYHLERLVEERLLVASEDGRRARYFKNGGAFSQAEREFVPVLQSKEAMAVLQVIVENPWCYRAEVAQKLGVSGPTVNWHLKKLMGVGVVKEMREGRVSYLYADKKSLGTLGANLVGKLPEDQVQRLRFDRRPDAEVVEPALGMPETGVPEIGAGEVIELAALPESA